MFENKPCQKCDRMGGNITVCPYCYSPKPVPNAQIYAFMGAILVVGILIGLIF